MAGTPESLVRCPSCHGDNVLTSEPTHRYLYECKGCGTDWAARLAKPDADTVDALALYEQALALIARGDMYSDTARFNAAAWLRRAVQGDLNPKATQLGEAIAAYLEAGDSE